MPPDQSLHLDAPAVEGDLVKARAPRERRAERTSPATARPPRAGKSLKLLWMLLLTALVGLVVWRIMVVRHAAAAKPAPGGRGGGAGGAPVPVVASTVQAKNVDIFLDGLGTVQALNTVTVRARVEGEVQKVAFREGEFVKEGALLAKIDPAPFQAMVDQAAAKLKQDQVQLANAQRDLVRDTELVAKKVIASQQFDTQKAQVAQFEALVKNDEAALSSAKVQLGYTTITSPLDGRTGIRAVDEGNIVRANDANGIVTITQLQPIALIFTLPEQNLQRIHQRQEESKGLKVLAVGRDNTTVLAEGKLTVIDNQIDTTTGTIKLKAEFPNSKYELWPGQFVNVRLLLETREHAATVPSQTVQRGPDSAFVYVIKPENTVEMRKVKVGPIEAGSALIESGLQAGERVVVDGQYKLQAGSRVVEPGAGGGPGGKPGGPGGRGGGNGPRPGAK